MLIRGTHVTGMVTPRRYDQRGVCGSRGATICGGGQTLSHSAAQQRGLVGCAVLFTCACAIVLYEAPHTSTPTSLHRNTPKPLNNTPTPLYTSRPPSPTPTLV
jgi:hypothetical protein